MDDSTANVTLLAGFIHDILGEYQHMKRVCAPAFDMAKGADRMKPDEWCSIDIYNDICTWIEANVGSMSIRQAGVAIGVRIAENIITSGKMAEPTPLKMMEALKWAASTMIRDPQGRGWEIKESSEQRIVMRRTQTFNCTMQEGLLMALAERTGVEGLDVDHAACTKRGDEFCDYVVTWI